MQLYVGKTTRALRTRMIEHTSAIRRDKKLLQREAFWIFELKSLFPEGMNEELELSC